MHTYASAAVYLLLRAERRVPALPCHAKEVMAHDRARAKREVPPPHAPPHVSSYLRCCYLVGSVGDTHAAFRRPWPAPDPAYIPHRRLQLRPLPTAAYEFMTRFSSIGPAADGRIKPDLVVPGHVFAATAG